MKKIISFLICLASVSVMYAQKHLPLYEKVSGDMMRFYNTGQYDSIFMAFSPEMKKALPMDKTVGLFSALKIQMGKMNRLVFQSKDYGAYYKGEFEVGELLVTLSLDDKGKIAGLCFSPFDDSVPASAVQSRNATSMSLPFRGEWAVVWGGDTKMQNYHVTIPSQKNAMDIVVLDEKDSPFRTDGKTNEDYYCFGREVYSPCDGKVFIAIDGVPDNEPGVMNRMSALGNSVVIETEAGEYVVLAHLKNGSVEVVQGMNVKVGSLLGICGNSGNSSSPHIHMHIQDSSDFNTAVGVKCFFDIVEVNGKVQKEYSPEKGDRIAPVD